MKLIVIAIALYIFYKSLYEIIFEIFFGKKGD